jgi:ribosomal protein L18E
MRYPWDQVWWAMARRLAPGYRRAQVKLAKLDRLEREARDDDG